MIGLTQEALGGLLPGKAKGSEFEDRLFRNDKEGGQVLIEFAGRLCYESFDLPNPKTKDNNTYVRNIVSLGHESVLEHVSVTFYVEGVSRNLSHELIRHRHLSFSELSQRYVNMDESYAIIPPALRDDYEDVREPLVGSMALHDYNTIVHDLDHKGVKGKKAREAARYVLPSGTETKFVVSGNLRAWRDVLKKRYSKHADAEMQLFAEAVYDKLVLEYPDVFADIEYN